MAPLFRPRRTLTALSAALLLAGCASTHGLAPTGHAMDPDTLAASRTLGGAATDAAFPKQDWWTAFGDPQLDRLIDEALAGTPTLDVADARVRQAVAQAGLADAARKPMLSGTAQYSGAEIPESIGGPLGVSLDSEDGEADREYEVGSDDRGDDAKDDPFQEPQRPHRHKY